MATSELLVTNGSTPATPASGKSKLSVNASKHLATVDDAGLALDFVTGRSVFQATPATPTGTTNTTGLMAGLAGAITPAFSGRVLMIISGNLTNTTATAGDGCKVQIRYGTGSAPANGDALTGTAAGSIVTSVLERATANDLQAFSLNAVVTGLPVGTAHWVDISQAAVVGGTTAVQNLSMTLVEV